MSQPLAKDQLFELLDELLVDWDRGGGETSMTVRARNSARVAIVHGLAAHVHRLAHAARRLLSDDLVLEALPLIRICFESALTAQWVVLMQEGAEAVANEDVRQRRALIESLSRATPGLAAFGSQIHNDPELPLTTNVSSRHFQQVCRDLTPGGEDAYSIYRLLSQLSHASVFVLDFYVLPHDGPAGVSLLTEPEQPGATSHLAILASTLVWAGRAVDFLDVKHVRRSRLREAAKELGITADLKPSDSAWLAGRS